jgi:hypothetical protein
MATGAVGTTDAGEEHDDNQKDQDAVVSRRVEIGGAGSKAWWSGSGGEVKLGG